MPAATASWRLEGVSPMATGHPHFLGPCLPSRRHPVEPELAALLSLGTYLPARQTGPLDLGRLCQVAGSFVATADKWICSWVELLETLWLLLPEAAPFPLPSFPSWSSVFSLLVVAHNRNYGCRQYRNRTILNSGFLYGQLVRRQYTWLHVD